MRFWPMLAMVGFLSGCMTAAEIEATAVDKAEAPIVNPDTIHVGEETHAVESACSPRLTVCIAEVRGLTWAVRPVTIAHITGYEAGQVIRVQGISPGRAWVVAMGQAGGDSSALQVIP
ncbi:MAG: hypothetical protein ACJ79K_16005 [Gemmatimonadaceae bacterium]